eukprot:g3505.t1
MPRRAGRGTPAAKHRNGDEDAPGRSEEASILPRAGDTARQIGMGFLKMADVVDEFPPLAKLFEAGLERFQEVFQAPGALLSVSGSGAGASGAQDPAKSPAGSKRKLIGGAAGTEGGSLGGRGSAAVARGSGGSPPIEGASWSEDGARGRRGTRRSNVGVEADVWPGLQQALRASKEDAAASTAERGPSKGVGVRSRPADPKANVESAKRGRKPSPPVPAAFGFPPAPPPRRAATEALHRMSALSSSRPSASPVAAADPARNPAHVEPKGAAAGAGGAAGSDGEGKKPGASTTGAPPHLVPAAKKSKKGVPGGSEAASASISKVARVDRDAAKGSAKVKGGGVASSGLAGGPGKKSKTTGKELLERLDTRVFRFVEAGVCQDDGCEIRETDHCHRGPGCDCTKNSDTYKWPSELHNMVRHQERHREWNKKPAFGKRVLVEFEDGTYYPGTINTYGDSAKDMRHSKGRWGVLFDDCSRTRFAEGDPDVMISSQPRLARVSKELYDYYLRHENGQKLLQGVKVYPETRNAEATGVAGEKEKQSPAGKKGGGRPKHKRHKSSANHKPQKGANRYDAGGASGKVNHTATEGTIDATSPDAGSASAVRGSGPSGAKHKRKHSVATEDEETDVEMEEQVAGVSPLIQDEASRRVARWDADGGGGRAFESDAAKGDSRGEKKGAGGSIGSQKGAGVTKQYSTNLLNEVVGTGNIGKDDHEAAANDDAKAQHTSGCGRIDGEMRVSHKMPPSKASEQGGEEGGGGGGDTGGIEESDEHSGMRERGDFKVGAGKHKKPKKSGTGKRRSRGFSSSGNGDGGYDRAEESNASGSPYAHRYARGSGTIVLSAHDSPGPSATVVGEGGGHAGEGGKDDRDRVGLDWTSPMSHAGTTSPSPNVGQEQQPPPPSPPPPLSPARQQQHPQQQQQQQQQPKRMTVSEEEESTDDEEETLRVARGTLGQGAGYRHCANNPPSPMSRSSDAASQGASGEANVVPVLQAPSLAATPDSTALSIAHVLASKFEDG